MLQLTMGDMEGRERLPKRLFSVNILGLSAWGGYLAFAAPAEKWFRPVAER